MTQKPTHGYLTEAQRQRRIDHTRVLAWLATGLAMAVIVYAMAIVRMGP